jgi:hypothetical protein
MPGSAWVSLLERIPTAYVDSLSVMTAAGAEIVLQSICFLDENFLVVRGRSAGSQDTGRVFVLPLAQIDYVGLNQRLGEPEVKAIFGGGAPVGAAAVPAIEARSSDVPQPPTAMLTPAAEPTSKKPAQVSKSILLARLRARLAQDGKAPER